MDRMESLYTETLEDLLENLGYGTENENPFLSSCLEKMDLFPRFVFGENISISMKELFLEKYDIREIGAETEQLFLHFWNERTNELLIEYVPKIDMWLKHFNDLFKFTVKLELSEESSRNNTISGEYSDNSSRNKQYYLNPVIDWNTGIIQDKNTDGLETSGENETTGEETKERSMSRDVLQSVWGKTRAQLMKQIFELQSIYSECLNAFSTIFMGVLWLELLYIENVY